MSKAEAGAPGTIRIESDDRVILDGDIEVSGAGAHLAAVWADAAGLLTFTGVDGSLVLHSWNRTTVRQEGVSPVDGVQLSPPGDHRSERVPLTNATLVLETRGEGLFVAAAPVGGRVGVSGEAPGGGHPFRIAAPTESDVVVGTHPDDLGPAVTWRWERGWYYVGDFMDAAPKPAYPAPMAPTATFEGPVSVVLHGGNLTIINDGAPPRQVRTGTWAAGPGVDRATSGTSYQQVVQRYVVLEGVVSDATLPLDEAWGLGGPELAWHLVGNATWPHATGEVTVGAETTRFEDAHVRAELEGLLLARRGAVASSDARYEGKGTIHALTVNGHVLSTAATAPQVTATVTAGALTIGVLLAWALYTRIRPEEVLSHPTRRAIYDTLQDEGGAHKRMVQRRLGLGWGTFEFHLRVLERHGFVRTRDQGGYAVLFAAHDDRGPSIPHPLARTIYECIPEDGEPVAFAEVCTRVGRSRQLVNYHIRRLEALGLVRSVGVPGPKRKIVRAAASDGR